MSNTIKTFDSFDKFDLKQFAVQLTKYLKVEAGLLKEGSFVLSLNSEFGSGKTTFFEMWQAKLQKEKSANVVLLNSWQSDFHGDALLAIISELLKSIGSKGNEDTKESIKENAGKLSKFALSIGNDIVSKFTGIDVIKAGERAESGKSKPEDTLGHACFEIYHERQNIFDELKFKLTELTEKSKEPIIIIIDELDRCRPTYAIEFLETIKHFFDIKGLIFVLGVDIGQLESSAQALFGHKLVFKEYYRKFAHRNVTLPVFQEEVSKEFYKQLINEYFCVDAFNKRGRFSLVIPEPVRIDRIIAICNSFSLNARQMHELFRIAVHILSSLNERNIQLDWGRHIGSIFMIAVYIKEKEIYHKIGRNEITLKEWTDYLKNHKFILKNSQHGFWWATLLYTGAFGVESPDKLRVEFIELGVNINSDEFGGNFKEKLLYVSIEIYGQIYKRSNSPFSKIYKTLEGLRTFEES